ncbi:MAG: 50S ribosomal protein L24 [Thermodesulfobacteriota bacterium]|nr:50S ribosomal protein L24 [Thermodesulfobacteriota bacterium]
MSQRKLHVKKDDLVMVVAGKEKGKTGKILKTIPEKNRVIVEKANFIKRHTRPSQISKGGIVEREGTIHISNVMIYCRKCSAPVRTGKKLLDDGRKVRICTKCKEIIDK